MLQLVIFDWDGTLENSINAIVRCKRDIATQFDLAPPNRKTIESVIGISFEEALKICFPSASQQILTAYGNAFRLAMQNPLYKSTLFPDTLEMLLELKRKRIKLAIATSKSRHELDHAIAQHHLENFFDMSCCGEEYVNKPDPGMLLHIMKKLNNTPETTLYIGDTATDVRFAHNANINMALVDFTPYNNTCDMKPTFTIQNWNELLERIPYHDT